MSGHFSGARDDGSISGWSSDADLIRYSWSFAFSLFSLPMYEALGVEWATTLLAAFTAVMAPIPWLFWKYGERIRRVDGSIKLVVDIDRMKAVY